MRFVFPHEYVKITPIALGNHALRGGNDCEKQVDILCCGGLEFARAIDTGGRTLATYRVGFLLGQLPCLEESVDYPVGRRNALCTLQSHLPARRIADRVYPMRQGPRNARRGRE